MILFVSGRTDIVAFYTKWFMNRYQEGYVDVRNPFNPKLVSRINFSNVDAILFCTKNPTPIINELPKIKLPILFHITLTPYKKDIEPNVPDKKIIINSIKKISKILGKDRVVVRYDPIFINNKYNLEYHKKAFKRITELLNGYIETIIISFIDDYKNVRKHSKIMNKKDLTEYDYKEIGTYFSKVAKDNNITVQTCCEENNLVKYGFKKGECLSHELAYNLTGKAYSKQKVRKEKFCQCVQMVDIGAYNSCNHLCKYCYANFDEKKIDYNHHQHNPNSSLLIGELSSDDIIKIRYK